MEHFQELTEITDSNIGFIVPDSQIDDENSRQGLTLFTRLTEEKSHHSLLGKNSPPDIHKSLTAGSNMSKRKEKSYFHLSSTTESEIEDQVIPLASDTISESTDSTRNETDRNKTVIARVINQDDTQHTKDKSFVSTSAQKMTSLRFSAEPMNVPETVDSFDEVAPTPDAFGSAPMIIPDSPCMDDKDEEDDEITFRPIYPTVDPDLEYQQSKQASLDQSESKAESQNFHLKLTPSQADILETSDVEDIAEENIIRKKPAAAEISPQKHGLDHYPDSEASKSLPSFHVQKPTLVADAMEGIEGSEENISVFRRIRSGNTTPQKRKFILDDSDEFLPAAKAYSLTKQCELRSPRKHPEKLPTALKSSHSKFLDKLDDLDNVGKISVSEKKHASVHDDSEVILIDKEVVPSHIKVTSLIENETWKRKVDGLSVCPAQSELIVLEDSDSQHVDEDLTLSYDYTGREKPSSAAHNQSFDAALVHCQINVAGERLKESQNRKSQAREKQHIRPHCGEELADYGETTEPSALNRKGTTVVVLDHPLSQGVLPSEKGSNKTVQFHNETLLPSTTKVSATSIKHEKRTYLSQESEAPVSKDPVQCPERKERSDGHSSKANTGTDLHESQYIAHAANSGEHSLETGKPGVATRDTIISTAKGVAYSGNSTLRQSKSTDPYTFLGSQSQNFGDVSRPSITERSHKVAPQRKRQSIIILNKILRKRIRPKQMQEDKKSSSTDTTDATEKKPRGQILRKKQQKTKKAEPSKPEQKQDEQKKQQQPDPELAIDEHTEFTSLQKKTRFNKPLDPPKTKSGPSSYSGHADSLTNKTQPQDKGQLKTKKSATVSFSGNIHGEPSEVSRELTDSSEHEVERTTVQKIMTVTVIVTERTRTEVYNDKGKLTRETENSVEVERTTLGPQVTSETKTERVIMPQISPSRSVSTVTTGDLADVSSSSLSRIYSSESKTSNPSIEAVLSCQSLPTPAQRQHSLEGIDAGKLQHEGKNRRDSDLPDPVRVNIILSETEQKRVSLGSNSDRDLLNTPNQSIIGLADSHIGKVVSSTNNTPSSQSLISPSTAISKPDGSKTKTTTPKSAGDIRKLSTTCHVTPSSRLPSGAAVKSASITTVSERGSRSHEQETSPAKGIYGQKHSETPQKQEPCHTLREKRLIKTDSHYGDTNNSNDDEGNKGKITHDRSSSKFYSKKRKISDSENNNLKSDKKKKKAAGKIIADKSKDDVAATTDFQSTGFSVHGAQPSATSGDSLLEPVSSKSSAGFGVSPEISLQGRTNKSHSQMVILKDYKSKAVTGAKVMGKWKDGYYYPGILSKADQSNKKYMVKFDDGSQCVVKANEIILAAELPVGQSVLVLTKNDFYEPGMVMGHSEMQGQEDSVNLVYHVERDDGVTQICERRSLILSDGQAACLLSDEEMRISPDIHAPSTSKPADISLDNLVDGKRYPRSAKNVSNKEDQPSTSGLQPTSVAASVSITESEACNSGRKRKVGPVATSTPTPKHVYKEGKQKGTPLKKPIPSPLGGAVASPSESRRTPRKARTGLVFESAVPKKSNLFEGIVFLLTHIKKSAEDRAQEKIMLKDVSSLDTSAEDNTDIEMETSPFVKEHLQAIIEKGGGQVIDTIDEVVMQSARQCYLVAAEHMRTVKYLQSLAAGITIISHQWVLHSAEQNKLQGLKAYILPAGISLEKKKLVEGTKGCSDLARQTIMVVSNNQDFINVWTSILNIAHSQVVTRFPARASKNDPGVDVVVSDYTCPANIVRRCQQLDVPLVSSEWIAQCLITGHLVDVKGHEKYKHDYT